MIPKELLPADLMGSAFIAGGYAACPALARDLDVWVYTNSEVESMEDVRARILTHLESDVWPYETADEDTRLAGMRDDNYPIFVLKVATVRSVHLTHPIHILVVNQQPVDLLETFDISTHQVALVFGRVVKGSGWTPVTVPPVKLRDTPTTNERMARIAARYGHGLQLQENS